MELTHAEDLEILRHCLAHFGGQFSVMLEYYKSGGKGAILDQKRIEELAGLSDIESLLSEEDLQQLEKIQKLYTQLREIYEVESPKRETPQLIADLILADSNEEEAIAACITNPDTLSELIKLVRMQEYSDPLYPGYGTARALAARTLGQMESEQAIGPLFECIGSEDAEEAALEALVHLPCKDFMFARLRSRPLSPDNERAAVVLASLDQDDEIASVALEQLQDPEVLAAPLSAYLVLCCSHHPEELCKLADRPECPQATREEIRVLSK